ncbi:hypothetical protein BST61_g1351 [Cercospora zeina]
MAVLNYPWPTNYAYLGAGPYDEDFLTYWSNAGLYNNNNTNNPSMIYSNGYSRGWYDRLCFDLMYGGYGYGSGRHHHHHHHGRSGRGGGGNFRFAPHFHQNFGHGNGNGNFNGFGVGVGVGVGVQQLQALAGLAGLMGGGGGGGRSLNGADVVGMGMGLGTPVALMNVGW